MQNIKLNKLAKISTIGSLFVMLLSILLILVFKLNLSIDFKGGSELVFSNISNVSKAPILELVSENNPEATVFMNDSEVYIRTRPLAPDEGTLLQNRLSSQLELAPQSFETIGPSIGSEIRNNFILAISFSILAILLYIAYVFRDVPKPYSSFSFGFAALFAMFHDVLVVLGVFAYLGHSRGTEISALFITALLTIIGFSVHDTIVVFDRFRENLKKSKDDFEIVAFRSLFETINRSLATSLTLLLTLLALYLLGGDSIKDFSLALLVGLFAGTYSSIFAAMPALVWWQNRKEI